MALKGEIAVSVRDWMKEGLNLQEISWCVTYLRTLSIKQACAESGIKINEASEMLNKPEVIKYIINLSQQYKEASEREREEELTREKISKVLEDLILSATSPPEIRMRAIAQLNSMKEFDKRENIKSEAGVQDEQQPVLDADEAEALLAEMRKKKSSKK